MFALTPGEGWSTVSLSPGVTAADVAEATGFPIDVPDDAPVTPEPTAAEREALDAVQAAA